MKFITVVPGCVAAALTLVACNDNSTPGGPDFGRDLAPGEYQVSVTGDVQRSFESTGVPHTRSWQRRLPTSTGPFFRSGTTPTPSTVRISSFV